MAPENKKKLINIGLILSGSYVYCKYANAPRVSGGAIVYDNMPLKLLSFGMIGFGIYRLVKKS